VPTQALALLNDPFVRKQAGYFAERCLAAAPADPAGQIRHAYLLALSREPNPTELKEALGFTGTNGGKDALIDFCHVLLGLNEFSYID
jgi:hypothetical protein